MVWVLTIGVLEVNPERDSIRAQRGRARSALFSRVRFKYDSVCGTSLLSCATKPCSNNLVIAFHHPEKKQNIFSKVLMCFEKVSSVSRHFSLSPLIQENKKGTLCCWAAYNRSWSSCNVSCAQSSTICSDPAHICYPSHNRSGAGHQPQLVFPLIVLCFLHCLDLGF